MPSPPLSPSVYLVDVAIVVGGSKFCLQEYAVAKSMVAAAGRKCVTFVCNDTIPIFPDHIDHAITLHPDKMPGWLNEREKNGGNFPARRWCHRQYRGFTDATTDWQGSSGLISVKIARELGFTHVILCGVPMDPQDDHIVRQKRWMASHGFRRGWDGRWRILIPYVRSMSGWTRDHLRMPTIEWIQSSIEDKHPLRPDANPSLRA